MTYSKKEGKKIEFYTTKYERSIKNRSDAVKIHGTKCVFNFANIIRGQTNLNKCIIKNDDDWLLSIRLLKKFSETDSQN